MDALQPGDPGSVGGYRLLGRLGAGGMGQVFLGMSPGGRKVAVKLIHSVHAGAAQFRVRFAREIEAARRVGGFHTALVVDADPHADPPWMVTAYIDGPSLQEAVGRAGPLPPDEVRALGAGLAEGLAAIHSCGLVHRDLKPGNVIMAADGPRIIDFGIARAIDASTGLTSTGAVVGTVAFMSPEQIRGEVAGPPSDVFSLGSVLAFGATGRPPFGGDSIVSIMFRVVNQPPDLAGVVDGELREVIVGCLAKSPGDRPAIQAVLAALSSPGPALVAARAPSDAVPAAAGYQTSTQTRAPKPMETDAGHQAILLSSTPPPSRALHARPSRGRPATLIAAAAAVVLAVILAVSLSSGSTPQAVGHRPRTGTDVSTRGTTPGRGSPSPTISKRSTPRSLTVSNVNVTGSGETLGVTATVRSSGDGTRCSVSVSGGSSATGSCDGTITVAVSMYNTSYTVTYTATNAVGSASHSVSATSGLKALTANATDAYGTCARYPQKFCGPDSDVEPGPTFTTSIGSVIGGTVMSLNCWTTGGIDYGNVPPYNAGTNVWVHVTNSPGPGYMSILWFPHPSSVTSGLPKC